MKLVARGAPARPDTHIHVLALGPASTPACAMRATRPRRLTWRTMCMRRTNACMLNEHACMQGHTDEVLDVAFDSTGSKFVSASADGTARCAGRDMGGEGTCGAFRGACRCACMQAYVRTDGVCALGLGVCVGWVG